MKTKLAYLGQPYSHDQPSIMMMRYHMGCHMTAELIRLGWFIYSPITHSHGPAQYGLPKDFEFWQDYCKLMLDRCDVFIAYCMPGWERSAGLTAELALWADTGKPLYMINEWSELPAPI